MRPLISACLGLCVASAIANAATPSWIWKSKEPGEREKVFFRQEVALPADIASASVEVTCDNWQELWVNGRDFGFSAEWTSPQNYDVTSALTPNGRNVIAVEGRNEGGMAAMALRLDVKLKSGKTIEIVSDPRWKCSSEAPTGWQKPGFDASSWPVAVEVAKMGDAPWGEILSAPAAASSGPEDMTTRYQVAKDFKLERLYHVPKNQGSWVAMTVDGKGHLLCSDQYGQIYRVTPGTAAGQASQVVPAGIKLGGAHGLLWNNGTLYVTVNEGPEESGVWAVPDFSGDKPSGQPKLLKAMKGRGEHGPHGLALSPDGKWIYVTAGNFTDLPAIDASLPNKNWNEDQLLPRIGDPGGHARDRMAPGGCICRFSLDGSRWELFACGLRNAYDLAFNDKGDLITYDSDMEWDMGMPWYRPTRICYVTPGAEFGWRNGSGPWPEYYEDSMAPILNVGPGSPTGVVSGRGAKFPASYQKCVFALDWTYATLYAIHLTPEGGGYKAEREEFVAGNGLPLTDAVVGADGAMYFLSGGRKTDSSLWRVTYTGHESVAPVPYVAKPLELADRAGAWDGMASPSRTIRYQSRLAVETVDPAAISTRLSKETDAWKTIGGAMALARTNPNTYREAILIALDRLDWSKLDSQQRINWLRVCDLLFIRSGEPKAEERARILAKIDAAFPSDRDDVNRELCRLLSDLQAPGIVTRTVMLMDSAGPPPPPDWSALAQRNAGYGKTVMDMIEHFASPQVLHYLYCLRVVKGPWTADERTRYFGWFSKLQSKRGGNSFNGFISEIRKQALENATPAEREMVAKLDPSKPAVAVERPVAKGPGRAWTIDEVVKLGDGGLKGDVANGRRMFDACMCSSCHKVGGEGGGQGGGVGPDLTTVAGRFQLKDLAEAIIDPSKTVSDQFAFDNLTLTDGTVVFGKIVNEKDLHELVATNPFDLSQTTDIERSRIKSIKPSPQSPMPPGLIYQLNPDELKDLLSYLLNK